MRVQSPWTVAPALDPGDIARAHELSVSSRTPAAGIRRLVSDSWGRSLALELDPDDALPDLALDLDALREYRDAHPLSLVLPTVQRLLIRHTFDSGLIVAVGDQAGRLLWIDGDRDLRRKAEGMLFVEGADWSEARVGTSAPGTALALDHGIQIQRAEHFTRTVHPWSCTAVPVHDPESGGVLGVIDITGGDDAVGPQTLPLIEATVAAVEAELRIMRLDAAPRRTPPRRPHRAPVAVTLHALSRDHALFEVDGRAIELSPRHAEILTLLAWHADGLSADALAELLWGSDGSLVTLRAEMVRLRRAVELLEPGLSPLSRPYRLPRPVELDAQQVLSFLDRGAHRVALAAYAGAVLPASTAPGIVAIRDEVSSRLRDALLSDAAVETLLDYARTDEAAYDTEVWRACLQLLPPRSPKRAGVVARLERIEHELGATPLQPRRA